MSGPRERSEPRRATVPYLATAGVLLLVVAVSYHLPWSRVHFPADFPPLFLNWYPLAGSGLVVPVLLGLFLVAAIPRLLRLPAPALLAALVAIVWLLAGSLAMQSGRIRTFQGCCLPGTGTDLLTAQFERRGEYFAAVPIVDELGPRAFAERFQELDGLRSHVLPLHVTTHPPGAPLVLWVLSKAVGGSVLAVSLLVTFLGALGVVPTYLIAREVYDERVARTAAVLFASVPGVLVYSATSMDVVFMTAVAFACAAVVRAPRSWIWAASAGALAAFATTLTWAGLVLGPIGLGIGLVAVARGRGFAEVAVRGAIALGAFVVSVLVIQIATGIDLVGAFGATMDRQTAYLTYRRSYGYWVVGNVVAFLIAAGIATTALLVAETRHRWRLRRPGLETVLWVTIVLSSVLGVFKGETDHSWLFFVPLAVAAAAPAVSRPRPAAGAGLAQGIATEVLFYTGW